MPPVAEAKTPARTTLRSLILDNYLEAGFKSLRSLGIAYARAKGISEESGIRDIRRYTGKSRKPQKTVSERTALVLANVLKIDPLEFERFLSRRGGGDAERIDAIETRLGTLEGLLERVERELRALRGEPPLERGGSE